MMLIAGTVPAEDLPLTLTTTRQEGDFLIADGQSIPCTQGTTAAVSAALATTGYLGRDAPRVLLAGDTGQGGGSRQIYDYLIEHIAALFPEVLVLHYWLPDMAQTKRLCAAVNKCPRRPIMIADAASMYSAKAAGLARQFDIFTPDATEMAFLADPEVTHPAYINRHLFDTDITRTPGLAEAAYRSNSAAKILLVKGATDYIIAGGNILASITEPDVPALEAIGGTGDTITGLVAALAYAGLEPAPAAIIAARANRVAGQLAGATPATKVRQVIARYPDVFRKYLCQKGSAWHWKEQNGD